MHSTLRELCKPAYGDSGAASRIICIAFNRTKTLLIGYLFEKSLRRTPLAVLILTPCPKQNPGRPPRQVHFLSPEGTWISGLYSIDPRITTLTLSAMTGSKMDFQLEIALSDIDAIFSATAATDAQNSLGALSPSPVRAV